MRRRLFRAYAALRARSLLRHLERIEASQWLSRDAVARLQTGRLREILAYAGRAVPHYRTLFRERGFDPASLQSVEDLQKLPLLDRDTLAERFDALRGEGAGPDAAVRCTGGSTGTPLRFLVDRHEMMTRSAHIYRGLRWLGWDLGERAAYVWGSDVDSREHRGLIAGARDWFAGVLWLDAFGLEEKTLDQQLDRLARFDPRVVIGYPSSLHLLARRAIETSRKVRLRGIETSAETLAPEVRRDLESAFGSVVLDRYGCREAGVIAHECPSGRMHVNAESVVVEVVEGEVVVTTLNNRAMPLVRYRVEDLADLSDEACPCGRGLPLVRRLQGRVSDIIRSPAGRLIHGEFFTHLFYGARGVKRFQVMQTAPDRLEVRFIATPEFTAEDRAAIEAAIRQHGDPRFTVDWIPVDRIATGPSGKFRFTLVSREKQGS